MFTCFLISRERSAWLACLVPAAGIAALDGGAAGDVDHVDAGLLEAAGHVDHVVEGEAAVRVLITGDAHVDDEVLAAALADLGDDLQQEAHARVQAAAVLVGALVVLGREEAAEHAVGVRRVDLDAVDTGLLHAHGRIAKLAGELVDLVDGDGTRRLAGIGRAHEGRGYEARRAGHVERHVRGMEQLRHDLGAILVDGGGQLLPAGDEGVVIAAHVAGQVGVGGLHGHDLGNDEAHAALGARRVMVDESVGHVAVIGKVGGHGRHEHAVLDLLCADLDGAEQHRVSLGFHESPPLSQSENNKCAFTAAITVA
jgi:hypothetical protein